MKKILLMLSFIFVLTLSACNLDFSPTPADETDLTREEVMELISQHLQTDLTEMELIALIQNLLPEDRHTTSFDLESFEESVVSMIDLASRSVVGIRNIKEDGTASSGSGVIYKVETNDYNGYDHRYYVITNHHVLENHEEINVVYERYGMLNDIPFDRIEVLGTDPITDIAVLTFESTQEFPIMPFADSYEINVGQFVFAIGNPLGFQYYATATMGIISGTARFLETGTFNATVIQHDAPISPGNSGGPLVDINGRLVGINHMKVDQFQATNIGFAVPSNTVQRIVNDLEEQGYVIRPFLGVLSNPIYASCGAEYGVCLADVVEGGAAEAGGLLVDDIIIGYKQVDDDDFLTVFNFTDLREYILNSRVGDEVVIQYIRNGEIFESPVITLNPHPDDQ